MIFAGILAGGIGSRVENSKLPKQFLTIHGIPMVIITIKKFLKTNKIDKVIIGINSEYTKLLNKILIKYNIDLDRIIIVTGGKTRFETLINITKKAYENDNNSIVISYDCARPFVSEKIILENLESVTYDSATTTSIPVIDSIIVRNEKFESVNVPNREMILLDQGPQAFYSSKFLNLIDLLKKEEISNYMEVGKLYINNSLKVKIITGEKMNFKVTTQQDFDYSEFLIEKGIIKDEMYSYR